MCNKCLGFMTSWSCRCGFKFDQHKTIVDNQVKDKSFQEIEERKTKSRRKSKKGK